MSGYKHNQLKKDDSRSGAAALPPAVRREKPHEKEAKSSRSRAANAAAEKPALAPAAETAAPPQSFSRAARHSRRVRFLKIALPLAAVLAAAVFSWFTFFAAPRGKAVISLNSENGQDNKLVMTNPNVKGYTKDNRPYAIKAEKAIQDPDKSGIIELRNIVGSVPLGGRGNADIVAQSAFYDNINGLLHFDKPFSVTAADGTSAQLLSAEVNVQSGQMNTEDKVEIAGATQRLTASSMRVSDSGRVIYFGGRVHIVIYKKQAVE